MHPSALTTDQAAVLADLALAVLLKRRGNTAALAAILSGRIKDLDPEDFRDALTALVKCASGSSLDVIAGLFGMTREIVVHSGGQCGETDTSISCRLFGKIEQPAWTSADELVGISLRTVLHFRPLATFAQQEAAIEKTVKAVADEIVRTQVDQTFRVNDLVADLRFTCQDAVIDVGEPNRPFEEILLWRGGKSEPFSGNYLVQPGERLVVEPSLPVAIDIRPAGGRAS